MSRREFYHDNPALVKDYFQAELIRSRREEAALWRSGIYITQGFRTVLDETLSKQPKMKYPERPLSVTQKEAEALEEERRQREIEEEKAAFAAFVNGWKKKQGGQQ